MPDTPLGDGDIARTGRETRNVARLMVIGGGSQRDLPNTEGRSVGDVLSEEGLTDLTGRFVRVNGLRQSLDYVLEGHETIQVGDNARGN